MTEDNRLLTAVDALTRDRTIHTTLLGEKGEWLRVHTETHPPLLTMLIDGTGITSSGRSSDPGIPIDADALEIWGQIRDLIKLWCKKLNIQFLGDDLLLSIQRWYLAHTNAHRAGRVSDTIDFDVTRMVEGWVRMIEAKFDPPEKREWKEACPAFIAPSTPEGEWKRCGARRIVVAGEERFAIILNVTTMTAECARCKCKWEGDIGILELRKQTELARLIKEEEEAQKAANDTPEAGTSHLV